MQPTLSPLGLAILGLLDEQPRHPYELAAVMRGRCMQEAIKLNVGSLYHAIEQLLRAGWIEEVGSARAGRRPERTVYRETPEGAERFRGRLRELIARPSPEYSHFEAGLAFLSHLDPDEAAALLRARADLLEAELVRLEEVQRDHVERGLSRLSLIEVEHGQAVRRAQAAWARSAADEIESGRLEWFAGWRPQPGMAVTGAVQAAL